MSSKRSRLVVGVVLGISAALALCCLGAAVVGLVANESEPTPGTAPRVTGTGFRFEPPSAFVEKGKGHWQAQLVDGRNRLWVDVQQLQALPVGDVDQSMVQLWSRILGAGYENPGAPLVQRRFVANGARAHFARATIRRLDHPDPVVVSLYLVEADDLLVPLVVVQGCDTNEPGALMIIQYSFPKSHELVEQLLAAVNGSPAGGALVGDDEVVGAWSFADTNTLQWAHTATGATAVTAVMRSAELTLEADHTFASAVTGGAGRAGQMKFASAREAGTWQVEHDVLVLTSEDMTRKYLVAGATHGPDGRRLMLLQPAPWSLGPSAEFELSVGK